LDAIGIFKGAEGPAFLGCDDAALLETVYAAAAKAAGATLHKDAPTAGTTVRRIGAVRISAASEEDPGAYQVGDPVNKPAGGPKPSGEVGSWTIQSLVFDADQFTPEQVRDWLNTHEGFGDNGLDETEAGTIRARQYDPEAFDMFRMISLAPGVRAVYGRIAKDASNPQEAEKAAKGAAAKGAAIHKFNRGLIDRGLGLLPLATKVSKADGDAPAEERFVLSLVLEPTDGNGCPLKPDTQGDIYSADSIRKACHAWMENSGALDLMHSWEALGRGKVRILENYIAPASFKLGEGPDAYDVIAGSWLLGVRIVDDALWEACKSGKLGAYSVGGDAVRTPVAAPPKQEATA
jgi:hypothetical protein